MESFIKRGRKPRKAYKSALEKAIKEQADSMYMTIKQLALLSKLDESTLYKVFSSGSAARDTIEKIASAIGKHPDYFEQFNGQPPYQPISSSPIQVIIDKLEPVIPQEDSHLYVPFYDIDITAGNFNVFSEFSEAPAGYIYAPEFVGCIACKVRGDSMYNRIMPGATVFVQHLESKKYIDYGQIYLLVLNDLRPLKYIFPHEDEDRVLLVSENQETYPSWSVEKTDIIHLFLVKGYINQNVN